MIKNIEMVSYMPGTIPKTKVTISTLSTAIKGLDDLVVRCMEQSYMQADLKIFHLSADLGCKPIDLKAINLNTVPVKYENKTFQPNMRKDILVLDVANIPGF